MTQSKPLLRVENLSVEFREGRSWIRAVDDASFSIATGEILVLVGESGSGKSTLARSIIGMIPATGSIALEGESVQR
ncbi:ATP-binding cassette domain-containing protein [Rhizobium sp. BE258]|uniref:ATP-binding cassette domain-containing protein n=1 Tax=Rhizobium sp. BE258 TaxID=2817722 RepID=UPI000DD5482F